MASTQPNDPNGNLQSLRRPPTVRRQVISFLFLTAGIFFTLLAGLALFIIYSPDIVASKDAPFTTAICLLIAVPFYWAAAWLRRPTKSPVEPPADPRAGQ